MRSHLVPQVSQMFGELVGVWCADAWLSRWPQQQIPLVSLSCVLLLLSGVTFSSAMCAFCRGQRPIRLVELGPGHGSLMADALRATRNLAGFHSSIQSVHLVEVAHHAWYAGILCSHAYFHGAQICVCTLCGSVTRCPPSSSSNNRQLCVGLWDQTWAGSRWNGTPM